MHPNAITPHSVRWLNFWTYLKGGVPFHRQGQTLRHFDCPTAGFYLLFIYCMPTVTSPPHHHHQPPMWKLSVWLSVSDSAGKHKEHHLEFLSRWSNHAAALSVCFWHLHAFVIAAQSHSFFSFHQPLSHPSSTVTAKQPYKATGIIFSCRRFSDLFLLVQISTFK